VFIADVVGLGKTFIGTTLLKHYALYRGARPLIVCPASLVEMWEFFLERYQINGRPLVFPERRLETIAYSIEETYRGAGDTGVDTN